MDQQQGVMCPRCYSTNTKFCYYNNYAKSQPRHFCRSCKKHWTRGGTLRNVTKKSKTPSKTKRKKNKNKNKNKKMGPTGKSGIGCSDVDEGLGQKMDDTQPVIHHKDESFGGVSIGFDQSQVLFDNLGCSDDVGLIDDNVFFDLETLFTFELPEVSEVKEKTNKDGVEDHQLACFPENADMDPKWEDVLEITQSWI